MVVPHGTSQRRQRLQTANREQPPSPRRPAHHHLQGQPPRHRHMPPGLQRQPGKGQRQRFRPDLPQCKELLQVPEGQGGVKFLDTCRGTDPRIHDGERVTMRHPQESSLGGTGGGHRRQIRHQLGIMGGYRGHDHRIGGANQGPPVGIFPQPEVFLRHQLVTHDAARNEPEAGLITGVDHLLRGGGMEVRHRLGRQDQRTLPRLDNRQRQLHRTGGRDGVVRAGRNAFTATDAVLLDDLHHARLRRQARWHRSDRPGHTPGKRHTEMDRR